MSIFGGTEEERAAYKAGLEAAGFNGPHYMDGGPIGVFAPQVAYCERCGVVVLLHQVMDNPSGGEPEKVDKGVYLHTIHHAVIDGMLNALEIMTKPKEES